MAIRTYKKRKHTSLRKTRKAKKSNKRFRRARSNKRTRHRGGASDNAIKANEKIAAEKKASLRRANAQINRELKANEKIAAENKAVAKKAREEERKDLEARLRAAEEKAREEERKAAAERDAVDRAAAERDATERAAIVKKAASMRDAVDRSVVKKAIAERTAAERAVVERAAAERAVVERATAEKAYVEEKKALNKKRKSLDKTSPPNVLYDYEKSDYEKSDYEKSDYEKIREDNIRKNNEYLQSIGIISLDEPKHQDPKSKIKHKSVNDRIIVEEEQQLFRPRSTRVRTQTDNDPMTMYSAMRHLNPSTLSIQALGQEERIKLLQSKSKQPINKLLEIFKEYTLPQIKDWTPEQVEEYYQIKLEEEAIEKDPINVEGRGSIGHMGKRVQSSSTVGKEIVTTDVDEFDEIFDDKKTASANNNKRKRVDIDVKAPTQQPLLTRNEILPINDEIVEPLMALKKRNTEKETADTLIQMSRKRGGKRKAKKNKTRKRRKSRKVRKHKN